MKQGEKIPANSHHTPAALRTSMHTHTHTHTQTHNGSEVLDLKLGSLVTGKRAWELVLWKAENHIYSG